MRDWRAHKGVDFRRTDRHPRPLPRPTASSNSSGQQRGYGNVVILKHAKDQMSSALRPPARDRLTA
jgi:hypothetical protein